MIKPTASVKPKRIHSSHSSSKHKGHKRHTSKDKRSKHWKKFTFAQIQEKVAQRYNFPNYYDILMKCAVHEDDEGVYFDVKHPAWKELIDMVKQGPPPPKRLDNSPKVQTLSGLPPPPPDSPPPPSSSPSSQSSSNGNLSPQTSNSDHRKKPPPPIEKHPSIRPYARLSEPKRSKEELLDLLSDALTSTNPDIQIVKSACRVVGIPSNFRAQIWSILLGLGGTGQHAKPKKHVKSGNKPLFNQRVIRVDIERTRASSQKFQDPETRHDMELILTEFCREQHMTYKQGMNYILAPFFMIGLEDIDEIYACYSAFILKILPNTFSDDEFGGLQCAFRMFHQLLLYHDPKLCVFLDQFDISPELYCSPWFMTLHSNRLEEKLLLYFWDHILLADDPRLHFFVSLNLLIEDRESIMAQNLVELPEHISKLNITSKEQMKTLIMKAKLIHRQTPRSYHEHLELVTADVISLDSHEYKSLETQRCLAVTSEEIISQLYAEFDPIINGPPGSPGSPENSNTVSSPTSAGKHRRSQSQQDLPKAAEKPTKQPSTLPRVRRLNPPATPQSGLKFFILDCRPKNQYDAGHLPCAYHLDSDLYLHPEELGQKVKNLIEMAREGCHFCFFGDGRGGALPLLLYFLQKGFKYVSSCEGGYRECHELVLHNHELVDHQPSICIECAHRNDRFGWIRGKINSLVTESASRRKIRGDRKKFNSLPVSSLVLPSSIELMLLHTILRDKSTTAQKYRSCVHRLISQLVSAAFDYVPITETTVKTLMNVPHRGYNTEKRVYGVALSDAAESAVRMALEVFSPVANSAVGQLKFEEKFAQDADGVIRSKKTPVVHVPPDISDRFVFLFEACFEDETKVKDAIDELLKRGLTEDDVILISLLTSRQCLWAIADEYPRVRMITTTVDAYQNGSLLPGMGNFEERYS